VKGKLISYSLIIALIFLNADGLEAQCGDCTTIISSNSVTTYTAGNGQAICIASGFDYTGTIVLDGGTLCNEGTAHHLVLRNGIFNNRGYYSESGNAGIGNTTELTINCFPGSRIVIGNNVDIQAVNVNGKITINQNGSCNIDIGGSFNCTRGLFTLVSTTDETSRFAGNNIFNVGEQFNISNNGGLSIELGRFSSFNVNKAASFDGPYNKTILNHGEMNFNNSFNVGGNGQNTGVFTLNNYGNLTITKFLNAAFNNGTTIINNYAFDRQIFHIGKSYTQSKDNTTFTNYGDLLIDQDCIVERGIFDNRATVTARDFDVRNGALNNSSQLVANRDVLVTNAAGVLNNSEYISVNRVFDSKGTTNLTNSSGIVTTDFYNRSQGNILGPNTINAEGTNYALILISRTSTNAGNIDGYIELVDQTLAQGSSFVDARIGNSNISARTVATISCFKIGIKMQVFKGPPATLLSFPYNVCPGTNVRLVPSSYILIGTTLVPYSPLSGFNWTYSGITGPSTGNLVILPAVANSFTATVSGIFWSAVQASTCLATKSVVVNVSAPLANAGADQIFTGVAVPIGSAPNCGTGGTSPYTISWLPTSNFVTGGPATCLSTVNPPTTTIYTLTITDASGCTAIDNVKIYSGASVLSYIVPKKKIDGGYQIPVSSKVYFKFDEEYRSSTVSYKIFDYSTATLGSPPGNPACGLNLTAKNLGDNRYYIDLLTCPLTPSQFYLVEVVNDKNEKFYFKFLN
jgi:hypothetical protein